MNSGTLAVSTADLIGADQLAVCIQRRPSPDITSIFRSSLGSRYVPLLRVGETPDLIALHPLEANAAHRFVVELFAGSASIRQKLHDAVECHAAHSRRRLHGWTLAEHRENLSALGNRKLVHAEHDMTTKSGEGAAWQSLMVLHHVIQSAQIEDFRPPRSESAAMWQFPPLSCAHSKVQLELSARQQIALLEYRTALHVW
jgi:hypothetical protein